MALCLLCIYTYDYVMTWLRLRSEPSCGLMTACRPPAAELYVQYLVQSVTGRYLEENVPRKFSPHRGASTFLRGICLFCD
jgi:hypothetical protein